MSEYVLMTCRNGESLLSSEDVRWHGYGKWRYCELEFTSSEEYAEFYSGLRQQWTPLISMGIKRKDFMPRAVFSDVDATLIPCESIEQLAKAQDCLAEVSEVTKRAMAGDLDFKKALELRLRLLAGLSLEQVEAIAQEIEPYPEVARFVDWCHSQRIPFHMVSGGFVQMLEILAKKLNIKFMHANQLEFVDGKMTGKVSGLVVDAGAKKTWMQRRCESLGLTTSQLAAIGDGANDLPMLQAVGLPIGFHPKPILYPYLAVINHTQSHEFHWKFIALRVEKNLNSRVLG